MLKNVHKLAMHFTKSVLAMELGLASGSVHCLQATWVVPAPSRVAYPAL